MKVPQTVAIVTVFTVLSCICVALRFYTRQAWLLRKLDDLWSDKRLHRQVILRNVGADDYAILLAQILNLGTSAANYAMIMVGGMGRHIQFVEDKVVTFKKVEDSHQENEYCATSRLTLKKDWVGCHGTLQRGANCDQNIASGSVQKYLHRPTSANQLCLGRRAAAVMGSRTTVSHPPLSMAGNERIWRFFFL